MYGAGHRWIFASHREQYKRLPIKCEEVQPNGREGDGRRASEGEAASAFAKKLSARAIDQYCKCLVIYLPAEKLQIVIQSPSAAVSFAFPLLFLASKADG